VLRVCKWAKFGDLCCHQLCYLIPGKVVWKVDWIRITWCLLFWFIILRLSVLIFRNLLLCNFTRANRLIRLTLFLVFFFLTLLSRCHFYFLHFGCKRTLSHGGIFVWDWGWVSLMRIFVICFFNDCWSGLSNNFVSWFTLWFVWFFLFLFIFCRFFFRRFLFFFNLFLRFIIL
jgi:hypothetical protein